MSKQTDKNTNTGENKYCLIGCGNNSVLCVHKDTCSAVCLKEENEEYLHLLLCVPVLNLLFSRHILIWYAVDQH